MNKEDINLLDKDLCSRLCYDPWSIYSYSTFVTVDYKAYLDWLPDDDEESDYKKRVDTYLRATNKTAEEISCEKIEISSRPCNGRFNLFRMCNEDYGVPVEFLKPFLRPMEDMTTTERHEYEATMKKVPICFGKPMMVETSATYDWLDRHMFDHRGLIGKGLAQPAPKNMYVFGMFGMAVMNDDFWGKCKKCAYFDGYDLCLHKKNFGSVTDETKSECDKNNYFTAKDHE